jgi:hypothetical protein
MVMMGHGDIEDGDDNSQGSRQQNILLVCIYKQTTNRRLTSSSLIKTQKFSVKRGIAGGFNRTILGLKECMI